MLSEQQLRLKIFKLKIFVGIIITVLLVFTGAAYWVGLYVEQQTAQIKEIESFDRGWFFSDVSSNLALANPALPPFELQHSIYHGPLPFIKADTRLNKNSAWCQELTALCTDEHRLLVSEIGLSGDSDHRLDIPRLQLDLPNGLLEIEKLTTELHIPLLHDTPKGSLQANLATLSWAENYSHALLKFSQLALQGSLETTDAYLIGKLILTAEGLSYGPDQAGPGEIILQAERIHYQRLRRLMLTWQRHRGLSPDFLLLLQELLSERPELNLSRSRINTSYGDLELEGQLLLHPVNMLSLLAQPLLLVDTAHLDVRAAKGLLEHVVGRSEKGRDRLDHWLQSGLVVLNGDTYQTQLRLHQARFYLNDTVLTGY